MSADEAVAVFRIEAEELLEQVERGLLDLAEHLDDSALVDEVFRHLHTLKGSGAMFGFDALAAFTHHCETAFDRVRKEEAAATTELVAAVLQAQDHMRGLLENPDERHEDRGRDLLVAIEAAMAGGAARGAARAQVRWDIRFRLPPSALINGTNPLILLDELREMGECLVQADLDAVPPFDQLVPTECHIGWRVTLTTDRPRSAIEDVFIFVMDDMTLDIVGEEAEPLSGSQPPLSPSPPMLPSGAVDMAPVAPSEPTPPPGREERPAAGEVRRSDQTLRVAAERLDELMDRVGELVIAQSRLKQLAVQGADPALRSVSEEVERLAAELRDTMMVVRMVPVSNLFSRFRRLVHDLARETGKSIELSTQGEATELDKTIIERLADVLVHVVRNAADHGLEPPQDRIAAGKPAQGRIVLSARYAGAEVVIGVSDDGRGIDRERVRARAEQNGLLAPGAQVSDAELLQMIFKPGFSTAETVTNLSGRGVGMDVVKRTIDGLRGSIDIVTAPGAGSEVSLRIPLTLAIVDGLLVRVGEGRYVVPLSSVEECLELTREQDLRSTGRSLISLRDQFVPFLRLREVFGLPRSSEPYQKVVVVSAGEMRVGLVVDEIIGDHQTVIKSLSKLHEGVDTFSGATILGDGSVALILDTQHLAAAGQRLERRLAAAS